jgi:hypothetical protein
MVERVVMNTLYYVQYKWGGGYKLGIGMCSDLDMPHIMYILCGSGGMTSQNVDDVLVISPVIEK